VGLLKGLVKPAYGRSTAAAGSRISGWWACKVGKLLLPRSRSCDRCRTMLLKNPIPEGCTVYYVRHGQTDWNAQERMIG
jgi:hypothetical protein